MNFAMAIVVCVNILLASKINATTTTSATTTTLSVAQAAAERIRQENAAVGPARSTALAGCQPQAGLQNGADSNMGYQRQSAYIMTPRLRARLSALGAMVSANAKGDFPSRARLAVIEAYWEPTAAVTVASPHYEGRAADVSIYGPVTGAHLAALRALAVEAGLDYAVVEDGHLHVSVIADSCRTPADIVFLLDGSGAVETAAAGGAAGNFGGLLLPFVQQVVGHFTIGANDTRVGVMTVGSGADVNFHLDRYGPAVMMTCWRGACVRGACVRRAVPLQHAACRLLTVWHLLPALPCGGAGTATSRACSGRSAGSSTPVRRASGGPRLRWRRSARRCSRRGGACGRRLPGCPAFLL